MINALSFIHYYYNDLLLWVIIIYSLYYKNCLWKHVSGSLEVPKKKTKQKKKQKQLLQMGNVDYLYIISVRNSYKNSTQHVMVNSEWDYKKRLELSPHPLTADFSCDSCVTNVWPDLLNQCAEKQQFHLWSLRTVTLSSMSPTVAYSLWEYARVNIIKKYNLPSCHTGTFTPCFICHFSVFT